MVYEAITWAVLIIGWLALLFRNRPTAYQTYGEADRERRLGGSRQARMLDIALETGDIPDDADREAWRKELTGRSDWLTRVLMTVTAVALLWDVFQRAQGQSLEEIARVALIIAAAGVAIVLAFRFIPSPKADAANAAKEHLLAQMDEERAHLEKQQVAYRVVAPAGLRQSMRRRRERDPRKAGR